METSSESESWNKSPRRSFQGDEAPCRPSRDIGRTSDQAGEISKKFKIFTKALQETNRGLTKVDQKLNLYREQTEADVAGQILKESNKTTSERQVSELKRAMDQKEQERDQLYNRLNKLSSELEELREIQNREQTERRKMEALLLERTRSRDKINQGGFQADLEQMTPTHAQLAQQLANEENSSKGLQRSSSELQAQLIVVLEERAALEQQLQLEREMHQKKVQNMKAMMEDSSTNRDHEVQAKMQAHLKEVKASGESDKELCGVLRATLSRTKDESVKMAAQLRTNDEAYALLQRKYQQLQQELDEKTRSGDQRHISELEEKVLQMAEQQKQILTIVGEELDATCLNLSSNCEYKQNAISQDPTLVKNIHHWLAETMTKLRWLCEEVRECVTREESLRKKHQQTRDQLNTLKQMWETCLDQLEKRTQSSSTGRESC